MGLIKNCVIIIGGSTYKWVKYDILPDIIVRECDVKGALKILDDGLSYPQYNYIGLDKGETTLVFNQ